MEQLKNRLIGIVESYVGEDIQHIWKATNAIRLALQDELNDDKIQYIVSYEPKTNEIIAGASCRQDGYKSYVQRTYFRIHIKKQKGQSHAPFFGRSYCDWTLAGVKSFDFAFDGTLAEFVMELKKSSKQQAEQADAKRAKLIGMVQALADHLGCDDAMKLWHEVSQLSHVSYDDVRRAMEAKGCAAQ